MISVVVTVVVISVVVAVVVMVLVVASVVVVVVVKNWPSIGSDPINRPMAPKGGS